MAELGAQRKMLVRYSRIDHHATADLLPNGALPSMTCPHHSRFQRDRVGHDGGSSCRPPFRRRPSGRTTTNERKENGTRHVCFCHERGLTQALEADIMASNLPSTEGFFFGVSDGTELEDDLDFIAKARAVIAERLLLILVVAVSSEQRS
jgi:hypothetical protein